MTATPCSNSSGVGFAAWPANCAIACRSRSARRRRRRQRDRPNMLFPAQKPPQHRRRRRPPTSASRMRRRSRGRTEACRIRMAQLRRQTTSTDAMSAKLVGLGIGVGAQRAACPPIAHNQPERLGLCSPNPAHFAGGTQEAGAQRQIRPHGLSPLWPGGRRPDPRR